MPERISGFRGEFLWEWDIVERQLLQLAAAFPSSDLEWRPAASARAVGEVFVHIAFGSFMLLESIGVMAPSSLYPDLPTDPSARPWAFVRRNDELERIARDTEEIVVLIRQLFVSVRESITRTEDAELDRSLAFFNETTTVRRVYLRLMAHSHEHMGQLIAYLRVRGNPAPWPDWRPDQR